MAKRSGSVAKFLIKWLVIPVGLAAIGFFVVGPQIGQNETKSDMAPGANTGAPPPETDGGRNRISEPEVEVTARPAGRRRSIRPPARTVTPASAPTPAEPQDEDPPATVDPPSDPPVDPPTDPPADPPADPPSD